MTFLHRRQLFIALFRSCTCGLFLLALSLSCHGDSLNFEIVPVAKDVYAVIAKPGMLANWARCNAAVIVNQNDVVVVDTQLRPSWAAEVISDIRKITDKPVRYVINTHWHRDHVQGNQVYLETFGPGVRIIQHEFTREDQIKNQPIELKIRAPEEISRLEELIRADKDEKGNPLDAVGLSQLAELLAARKAYFSEVPNIAVTPGTLTFAKRMVLYDGGREIDLCYFGFAHTRGDTIVYLPAEKVVITGDVSQVGVPDTRTSYPVEWLGVLQSLDSLDWTINIPGHGKVQNGKEAINSFMSYLNDLVSGVKTAVARNLTEDQTVESVDLKRYATRPDYGAKNETAVRRTYEEVSGKPGELVPGWRIEPSGR
jgi:glyoxylase-like metal-dependent hydrolase (beta-lactamase superfamily II)